MSIKLKPSRRSGNVLSRHPTMYYRSITEAKLSRQEVTLLISEKSDEQTLTVNRVLRALAEVIGEYLSRGCKVEVHCVGEFSNNIRSGGLCVDENQPPSDEELKYTIRFSPNVNVMKMIKETDKEFINE